MVAISVVGGILIFVFSQGFFQDTQIAAPTIENVEIWGYNATDRTTIGTHTGTEVAGAGAKNNKIADGEDFTVFIRNSGGGDTLISEVEVFGVKFTYNDGSGALATTAAKDWTMSTNGKDDCLCQIISAGQEATILIGWEEDVNGPLKVGRPITVKITTGAGATFTKQIVSGRDVG